MSEPSIKQEVDKDRITFLRQIMDFLNYTEHVIQMESAGMTIKDSDVPRFMVEMNSNKAIVYMRCGFAKDAVEHASKSIDILNIRMLKDYPDLTVPLAMASYSAYTFGCVDLTYRGLSLLYQAGDIRPVVRPLTTKLARITRFRISNESPLPANNLLRPLTSHEQNTVDRGTTDAAILLENHLVSVKSNLSRDPNLHIHQPTVKVESQRALPSEIEILEYSLYPQPSPVLKSPKTELPPPSEDQQWKKLSLDDQESQLDVLFPPLTNATNKTLNSESSEDSQTEIENDS